MWLEFDPGDLKIGADLLSLVDLEADIRRVESELIEIEAPLIRPCLSEKPPVYRAEDGWRLRARADNGEIVSESGEAYEHKSYALEAGRRFGPADAEIEVEE